MFRASPWISYEPSQRQSAIPNPDSIDHTAHHDTPPPQDPHIRGANMDAPEISILREEEEETPPPESGGLTFSKFRVNLRLPARGQGAAAAASGSVVGPPVGPPGPSAARRAPSPPDSDDDEEEDQLIDDDELAIVTETGRGPTTASPASLAVAGSPASTPTPRKRGGATRGRQRRGGATGRRGRPGREPPDAAAMMSTFELTKTDQTGPSSAQIIPPPPVMAGAPPPVAGPSTGDWSSAPPPKPPRKKPGPKKGSTLGPRGPRKNAVKTAQNTPGASTPVHDDPSLPNDVSAFLIPSIPPTPGSDLPALPPPHLPQILPPDFNLDPTTPVPMYPLPSRAFPVQAPAKIPSGYATTHPVDTKRGPVRKWQVAQREIKGIAGGRWFARSWVSAPQNTANATGTAPGTMHSTPGPDPLPAPIPTHPRTTYFATVSSASRQAVEQDPGPSLMGSRASSVKAEAEAPGHHTAFSDSEHDHWSHGVRDDLGVSSRGRGDGLLSRGPSDDVPSRGPGDDFSSRPGDGFSSRGPASPHTRTSVSPSPPPAPPGDEEERAEPEPGPS